jgi:hypothetical protein
VEVTSRAFTQGAFFGLFQESTIAVARHKALVFPLALYLFDGALTPMFSGCFSLYNCYKAFRRTVLNKENESRMHLFEGWAAPFKKKCDNKNM